MRNHGELGRLTYHVLHLVCPWFILYSDTVTILKIKNNYHKNCLNGIYLIAHVIVPLFNFCPEYLKNCLAYFLEDSILYKICDAVLKAVQEEIKEKAKKHVRSNMWH